MMSVFPLYIAKINSLYKEYFAPYKEGHVSHAEKNTPYKEHYALYREGGVLHAEKNVSHKEDVAMHTENNTSYKEYCVSYKENIARCEESYAPQKECRRLFVVMAALLMLLPLGLKAQSAFQAGETLQYNLYYNWGLIWAKAGSATMSVSRSSYNGIPAYRTRLLMRGTKEADGYFVLRDTLTSYISLASLKPLYYIKEDLEGKKHRRREVWYSYPASSCRVRQRYVKASGDVKKRDESFAQQVHDMLSITMNARSWDTSTWRKGRRIKFYMTDGNGVQQQTLIYRGKTRIKARGTNDVYRCIQLSFIQHKDDQEKEVITFYITDDLNHVPVRLDMNLKIGAAKAYLVGAKGLKNTSSARIK